MLACTGVPRHGNGVADIFEARRKEHEALETHAPTRVGHRAIPAQIKVPLETCRVDAGISHLALEHLVSIVQ